MENIIYAIGAALIGLGLLIVIHEWGHFLVAKLSGVGVVTFSVGFGPKLWVRKKGETEYSINALPIGGFVKIFGENPDEENTNGPDSARSFVNKPKWQQAIVLFAGVLANFLLAWVLFSFGFMSGLPTSVSGEITAYPLQDKHLVVVSVLAKSPAEIAGLKTGDKIVSLKTDNEIEEFVRLLVEEGDINV